MKKNQLSWTVARSTSPQSIQLPLLDRRGGTSRDGAPGWLFKFDNIWSLNNHPAAAMPQLPLLSRRGDLVFDIEIPDFQIVVFRLPNFPHPTVASPAGPPLRAWADRSAISFS